MVGADNVRAMLGRLIREESLRTYLFTYAHVYASLSLRSLADMFELPRQRVHSLVSKMIINEELLASLDDPSECAILHRSEPSRMQALALQLADKVQLHILFLVACSPSQAYAMNSIRCFLTIFRIFFV